MARSSLFISLVFYVHLISMVSCQQELAFIYNGFSQEDLYLDGIAEILPSSLLQLTNTSNQKMGHAFYKQPFEFNSSQSFTFSTYIVFALVPQSGDPKGGGHGMAFVISPSLDLSYADPTQYLGLLNISNIGSPTNHLLAVEFDTVITAEFDDINSNHVGIDVNSLVSVESAPASYFSNTEGKVKNLTLLSGDPIQAWIDYDGTNMLLNVTIAPIKSQKPDQPLLSRPLNLSEIFLEKMYVGLSAATGQLVSDQYVLGWSFSIGGVAQSLNISKLPRLPPTKKSGNNPSALLIILLIFAALILMAIAGGAYFYHRKKYAEIHEEWEKEYGPHRFSYRTLYKATKGFDKTELLGKGGFGEVYRGLLPSSNKQIAVKKVNHDAEQGMKQFVAEIVSMGRLKNRNLVPLLGYCRRKGELLLVSEYMPNGSLDHYLFSNEKPVLTWSQRLHILRGIAFALDYLHRGVEQVVLHRDIKASNIMLDADLNGRLGDFGMAKFHDHGAHPQNTAPVGTIGYMAPELTTIGASTRTDVFAFGAFILEVTCGRRPVELALPTENRFLVKWVTECWKRGSLFNATDPRFGRDYVVEEVEMVLKLGLLCSHLIPESRPTMEQVVQYLNGNADLPDISPYTPGIGVFTPIIATSSDNASTSRNLSLPSNPSSANNSMFVSHTILYGGGR